MSDELRPNETPRSGENVNRENDKNNEALLIEACKFVEEKVNDYIQNGFFDPELQRWLETFNERDSSFGWVSYRWARDHGLNFWVSFCYDLCFAYLLSLSKKTREDLNVDVPPTKEGLKLLNRTISFIDRVLAFTVDPKIRTELFMTKALVLFDLTKPFQRILPSLKTLKHLETLSAFAEEAIEASLGECKKILPKEEKYLESYKSKIQNLNNDMGLLGLRRVGSFLRTSCEDAFGKKYAIFDNIEEFLGNDSISENKTRELRYFLVNPPKPRQNHPEIKNSLAKAALAGLCCRLLNNAVFDKLKSDIVFDKSYLRHLRDRYIRDIFFQESSYVLRNEWETERIQISCRTEVPDTISLKQTHRLDNEDLRKLQRVHERELEHRYEYWRTPAFNVTSARRNSALLFCYLALTKSIDTPIELIIAAIGTSCLDHWGFENALVGKTSFKEVLLVAQKNGRVFDCARAAAILSNHKETVYPLVEMLLDEADWTGIERLKSDFYDYLDKLAGGGGIPYTHRLLAAADSFSTVVNDFTKFRFEEEGVSENADKLLKLFEKYSSSPWTEGELITLDMLKESLGLLKGYDSTKRFEGKYRIVADYLNRVRKICKTILSSPSIILDYCYFPKIVALMYKVAQSYARLCETTKPRLVLGDAQSVEVKKKSESEIVVRVPITNVSDEYAQNALNVRLWIRENLASGEGEEVKEHSRLFALVEEPCKIEALPSGGRTEIMEFTLRLFEQRDVFPIQLQVEYEYFSGSFGNFFLSFYDLSRYDDELWCSLTDERVLEDVARIVLPGDFEHFSYDIVIPGGKASKKKHELGYGRLSALGGNGSVDYEVPGVRDILNNRSKLVDRAIDALIVDREIDDKKAAKKFSSRGRLDIVYGQWRVGKTVILELIEKKLRHGFPNAVTLMTSIYNLDLNGNLESSLACDLLWQLEDFLGDNELLSTFFHEVLDSCHIDLYNDENVTWISFSRFLKLFIAKARKEVNPDFAIIWLVDEFTGIYPKILDGSVKADFLSRWVQMIKTTNLLCVVAGGEHTWDMMETYGANAGQKADALIYVDYLSLFDVEKIVRYVLYEAPEDNVSPSYSYFSRETERDAFDRIYELTRGNPFLLWHLCGWLIAWLKTSDSPFLTKTAVDDAIDFKLGEGTDIESLEHVLFYPLYNPFGETDFGNKVETPSVAHLKDDRVRDDNRAILGAIVDLANPNTHLCGYNDLKALCIQKGMNENIFERRFKSLVSRNVVKHADGAVAVFVGLYYEIKTRIERKRKNDLR